MSCMTGSATEVLKNIPTTEGNYQQAYNALIERYENSSLIIQSHIRSLLDTPKAQSPSAVELTQLHQHITSHVKALEALSQPIQH